MLGRHLFTLDGERFLLVDAFATESGPEWHVVPEREAAFVVDAYFRRSPDSASLLAALLESAHDVVTSAAPMAVSTQTLPSQLRDELQADRGRLVLFRRDPPSLRVPPPRDPAPRAGLTTHCTLPRPASRSRQQTLGCARTLRKGSGDGAYQQVHRKPTLADSDPALRQRSGRHGRARRPSSLDTAPGKSELYPSLARPCSPIVCCGSGSCSCAGG